MKAVILAAGHGSRLREISDSKPLTPVGGTPLIEHVIAGAAIAGIDEAIVVTGHAADRVEAHLAGLSARIGVTIRTVRLADWDLPNGHSLVAGAAGLDSPFLLLMSDHLFDPALPARLIREADQHAALTLAVDRDLERPSLDIDDATTVAIDASGRIVRIAKTLEQWDAVDTGIFLATPALAEAVAGAVSAGGSGSLSEGVQRLADAGRAFTLDVTGMSWLDVDDRASLAHAEKWVGRGLSGPVDGADDRSAV